MELTILNLVLITFLAGVVGGLVIAEQMDPTDCRASKRMADATRTQSDALRQPVAWKNAKYLH